MATRTAAGTVLPDDFGYQKHPELKKWIESEYPQLDSEKTMERFIEYAEDSGRIATKWTAAFKRVIRTGVDNGWKGICVFRQGIAGDPRWKPVLTEADDCGFRKPQAHETPSSYRTDMERWKDGQKRARPSPVIDFSQILKKIG